MPERHQPLRSVIQGQASVPRSLADFIRAVRAHFLSLASSPRFSLRIHEEAPGRRTNHQGNRGSHAVSGKEGRLRGGRGGEAALGTSGYPGGRAGGDGGGSVEPGQRGGRALGEPWMGSGWAKPRGDRAPPVPPQFDGLAKEEIQQVTADFCSYQSIALELIKTKQRKETRFQIFMQVRSSPGPLLALALPRLAPVAPRGLHPLPPALGSRKQPAVPAPAAQGLDHLRNAAPDQVPAAAGEHPQAHRG